MAKDFSSRNNDDYPCRDILESEFSFLPLLLSAPRTLFFAFGPGDNAIGVLPFPMMSLDSANLLVWYMMQRLIKVIA